MKHKSPFLDKIFNGKRVAIVGNCDLDRDYSEEIDSHDVVIRLNHFYNYKTNLCGKRIDYVFQTFAPEWANLSDEEANIALIKELNPIIISVRRPEINPAIIENRLKGVSIYNLPHDVHRWLPIFTTGTVTLGLVDRFVDNAEVNLYGFSKGEAFNKYINENGQAFKEGMYEEDETRLQFIENISKIKLHTPLSRNTLYNVIPVRGSKKNIALYNGKTLLQIAIDKLNKNCIVISDDDTMLSLAKEYGAFTYKCKPTKEYDDVIIKIREWVEAENIYGWINQIQVTSPELTIDDINNCIRNRDPFKMVVTVNKFDGKASVLYTENGNQLLPINQSDARQTLPPIFIENGGVHLYASEQVFEKSIYSNVIVSMVQSSKEITDIDYDYQIEEQERKNIHGRSN